MFTLETFTQRAHAWAKLWKHHAAQPHADRITETAVRHDLLWLKRYGGKVSSEWLPSKVYQILEEDPEIYDAAEVILEGGDWIVWQLTGKLTRKGCDAGYKALWHKKDSFPSSLFLSSLHPRLGNLYDKFKCPVVVPGTQVGILTPIWAEKLGLQTGIPVAAAIIDAHSATLGGGVTCPGILFMIMGTSTCHMLMAENEVLVPGIAGVVEDGIAPGLYGYEAGQVAVGDSFAWFIENGVPPDYVERARKRDISLHILLSEKASTLFPGQSGLLALDWWNGNRTPLVNAELSGLLIGCTLATKPEEIYRALVESTDFGTRWVVEKFTSNGVPVESIVAVGGLVKKEILMQIYADITLREISVASSLQVSALGAVLLATVAAGKDGGGYASLTEAAAAIVPPPLRVFKPNPISKPAYDVLYAEYLKLCHYFGSDENQVMEVLRGLRRAT